MTRSEPTVVYVHGNGNKLEKAALKDKWDNILYGSPQGDRSRMAHYADLLYDFPLPHEPSPRVDAKAVESFGDRDPEPLDQYRIELLAELEDDLGELNPKMAAMLDAMVAATPSAAEASASRDEESALELLPSKWLRERALRRLTKTAFKDVYKYLFGSSRQPIMDRLRAEVEDLRGPVVVVGHSLGSIVAFDVLNLWEDVGLDVKLFLTVGSPLGVKEIQDQLLGRLQVPDVVSSWLNLADPWDLVALDKTLKQEFPPNDRVEDKEVNNWTNNNHSIDGYLDRPEARQAVDRVLG